ncbi:MAG: class I adenylate-forming enzyme family protein [Acidimicrobiales bacterium]
MNRLIALALPGSDLFVAELQRAWGNGDAVLPVDMRLPPAARQKLFDAMSPAIVVDEHGQQSLDGARAVDPGDALVMATSGSTGDPKGVVLTHEAIAANAEATSRRLNVDPNADRWLCCLPLSHVGGMSVVVRALHTGTPLTMHPGFEAGAVMEAARLGSTLVSLVATALRRIDPTAFRAVVLGGSAMPADRPANSVTTYGMTETGSGVVYDRLPVDGVEVSVVDGEIHLRCPMLLRCYRDGTDPKTADGWLPTGDAGTIDVDGRLQVHGRRGDLIITGGENVWPDAVERVLALAPGVAELAVVGRPDPEWGAVVTAVVVPAQGAEVKLGELREQLKEVLPAYCAPRALELAESLPRTALGKVQRHLL